MRFCLMLLIVATAGGSELISRRVDVEVVAESLRLGRVFLLANQRPEGNFHYLYNIDTGQYVEDRDSSVRQAGTLWALGFCHRERPAPETAAAFRRGIEFWYRRSQVVPAGRLLTYPGEEEGPTGALALVCLALTEVVRQPEHFAETDTAFFAQMLDECLDMLLSLRRDDGHFAGTYAYADGAPLGPPSPYYDGESLLALVRAARFLDYAELEPRILASAHAMYHRYVLEATVRDPDSDRTKGFYQWASMAFYDLYHTGWEGTGVYAERTVLLAHWMIDVHQTLRRTRNTGYACEGMAVAVALARELGDEVAAAKFATVVDLSLRKLCGWQIGNRFANDYLRAKGDLGPPALGGVLNHRAEPWLRIDVTQHQMHALMLAREHVYADE